MFYLKIISITLLIQNISSDCSPPAQLLSAYLYGYNIISKEDSQVDYRCKHEFLQVYNAFRVCTKGKWTGRVPKCGEYSIPSKFLHIL
jgi:hypothetical protein